MIASIGVVFFAFTLLTHLPALLFLTVWTFAVIQGYTFLFQDMTPLAEEAIASRQNLREEFWKRIAEFVEAILGSDDDQSPKEADHRNAENKSVSPKEESDDSSKSSLQNTLNSPSLETKVSDTNTTMSSILDITENSLKNVSTSLLNGITALSGENIQGSSDSLTSKLGAHARSILMKKKGLKKNIE